MTADKELSEFLQSRIAAGDFPSAVYLVGERERSVFGDSLGTAVVEPENIPASGDTIYDLASLTKVMVTTLLVAKLVESGEIWLGKPISEYLPEFDTADKRTITVRDLATHSSGFRAWLPFYLHVTSRFEIPKRIAAEPLENQIGSKVVYSDLNFLVLTFLIERICGKRIDAAAREMIFEPLRLRDTFFNPSNYLKQRIAASENGNRFERQTCIDLGYDLSGHEAAFRTETIWGEVHDGNCRFMNGISGHAGLFSTAVDTFIIARQFLPLCSSILRPETCEIFRTNLTEGLNEARSVGFQLAATPESTASKSLAQDSFGHLGFTGTSLWIEPDSERVFILLTNRTHAHELPFVLINSVRRRFHEMAAAALDVRKKQNN